MRKVLLILIFFTALPLFAKDVYKWTNADGVVIYSDTYQEGAERIRVSGSTSSPSNVTQTEDQAQGAEAAAEDATGYTSLEIVQPENDQTIRSNEGTVAVGLALSPTLAEGHSVRIVVDGSELPNGMQGTQFTLNNLNRGSHSLETRVVDADGNVLINSNRITFHLRKASILTP